MAQALEQTRFFARDARFGEDERAAFGIIWQEDLFAEGDEDNRFTVDGEAFVSAQHAWLDANMPKNGVMLEVDQYGREKLPPRAQPTWTKPKKRGRRARAGGGRASSDDSEAGQDHVGRRSSRQSPGLQTEAA